jgi:hypothetical protein
MHGLQLLNNMVDRWVETLPAPVSVLLLLLKSPS